ncbi:MAG: tetratricopeptide repeat protein [Deltaproteobacteria bacterium]
MLLPALLLLAAAGCGESSKPSKSTSAATAAGAKKERDEQCESILASIDDIFQLERLGRTTAVSDGVSRLNDWQRSCAPEALDSRQLPADAEKLLSEEQRKALGETRFLLRDGEHVRNCMLERAISLYGVGAGQTELEKVTNLFGHVVRAVGLVSRTPQDPPLTPYEVCLLGKGTAEDRAWIFVNVLRQMKLDGVLLSPKSAADDSSSAAGRPFLVGVLLDGQVYLFDPQNGLAIPVPVADPAAPPASRVATLAQAANDPAILKQLDAGAERTYPIRAADLASPEVVIVGDSSLWSGRMEGLQTQFVGNRAMVISDPLADAGGNAEGVWMRVLKAGRGWWAASQLHLWEYPEARLSAHLQMTKDQRDSLEGLMKPFEAFMNVPKDPQTGQPLRDREGRPVFLEKEAHEDPAAGKFDPGVRINIRLTKGEQMRARLAQLAGDLAEAVKAYTVVRSRSNEVLNLRPPIPIRSVHVRAIDDAIYWTALCQFEQGEFVMASNTLRRYRKRAEPGHWMRESRYLLALSLAAAGDHAAAVKELETIEPDDPEYLGYRFLIRQWKNPDAKR